MKIGADIGNTIYNPKTKLPFPGALETITRLVNDGHEVYLISKVNSEQQARSLKWLADVDFFNFTGVKKENLYYCFERKDKAIFVKALGIDIFIDDRPEVLYHMESHVKKFLINATEKDVLEYKDKVAAIKANNWDELSEYLKNI